MVVQVHAFRGNQIAIAPLGRVEMDLEVVQVKYGILIILSAEEAAVLEVPGFLDHMEGLGAMVETAQAPTSQALPHFMAAEVAAVLIGVKLVLEAWVVGATGICSAGI